MSHASRRAPAKTNLHLEILGRRDDGFHELETVFATLDLHDTISVTTTATGPISLALNGPTAAGIPTDASNLIWRAAAAWRDAAGLPELGIACTVDKQIPAGGGLGGGSSDAAATLRALQACHPDRVAATTLAGLAAELGSDVPVFLLGGCCHATGRGEVLTPLDDLPASELTVIVPPFGCSTPSVFRAMTDRERGPRQALGPAAWREHIAARGLAAGHNRLTAPARRVEPRLDAIAAHLDAIGQPWWLSGSGACCIVAGRLDEDQIPAQCRALATTLSPRAISLS